MPLQSSRADQGSFGSASLAASSTDITTSREAQLSTLVTIRFGKKFWR